MRLNDVADSEKIRKERGWKPKYEDIKTIITTAWNWHQKESRQFIQNKQGKLCSFPAKPDYS
jgi:UDP-glucose 4-epimerase